jgi:hypothetical protein
MVMPVPRKLYKYLPDGLNFSTVDGDDGIVKLFPNPSTTSTEGDESYAATKTFEIESTAQSTA